MGTQVFFDQAGTWEQKDIPEWAFPLPGSNGPTGTEAARQFHEFVTDFLGGEVALLPIEP